MFNWLRNKVKARRILRRLERFVRQAIDQNLERYIIAVDTRQPAAYLRENLNTTHRLELGEIHYDTKHIDSMDLPA